MYTDVEICTMFRNMSLEQDRIDLLKQLTGYSKLKLVDILKENGYEVRNFEEVQDISKSELRTKKFLEFYKMGFSDRKIAGVLDLSEQTIRNLRHSLDLKSNKYERINVLKEEFKELNNQGVRGAEIARILKVTQSTISLWKKELKLTEK